MFLVYNLETQSCFYGNHYVNHLKVKMQHLYFVHTQNNHLFLIAFNAVLTPKACVYVAW